MRSAQEILEILQIALPELARDFHVTRLALFGSYARGQQTEASDVDILVEVDPSIGLRFVDLAERIESLLGVRADVVSRRAITPRHWAVIESAISLSPINTHTWNGNLSTYLPLRAIPTPIGRPWPREPVATSTQGRPRGAP